MDKETYSYKWHLFWQAVCYIFLESNKTIWKETLLFQIVQGGEISSSEYTFLMHIKQPNEWVIIYSFYDLQNLLTQAQSDWSLFKLHLCFWGEKNIFPKGQHFKKTRQTLS